MMCTLCLLTSFSLPPKKKEKIAGTKFLLGKAKYMLGQVRSGQGTSWCLISVRSCVRCGLQRGAKVGQFNTTVSK